MPDTIIPINDLKVNQSFEHLTLDALHNISKVMQHALSQITESHNPSQGIKIERESSSVYQVILTDISKISVKDRLKSH